MIYDSILMRAMQLLRNIDRILLTVVCMLVITQIYGLTQETGFFTICGNGSILFLDAGSGSVVITNGHITVTEGKSVKLMPGTHIREGSEMAVSIATAEHKEALAKKAAEEQRDKSYAYIMKQLERLPMMSEVVFFFCKHHGIPGTRSILNQQRLDRALLPAPIQTIPAITNFTLIKSSYQPQKDHLNSTFLRPHFPLLSWGERAETIRVMLT